MSDPKYAYPYPAPQGYYQGPYPPVMAPPQYDAVSDPKYAYPYLAQGYYYQGPPVMAPPPQYTAPPPREKPSFLEGCLAALRCFCLIQECCTDPASTVPVDTFTAP